MRWNGKKSGVFAGAGSGPVAAYLLGGLLLFSSGCLDNSNSSGRSSPLVVDAGPDVQADIGVAVELAATVSGGQTPYSLEWSPSDGLDDPTVLRPKAAPASTTGYTLTATDSRGAKATDQVTVTVHVQPQSNPGAAADKFALWNGGVKLRGANIVQRHVYPELDGPDFLGPGPLGPPYTQDDFDQLAALGANCVLLSHTGLFTVDPPYVLDDAAQASLDQLIAMAAQANLFVVINARSGPGRSEFDLIGRGWLPAQYINDAVWSDPAAQDAWADMWQYTASRYKDNPTVVGYELLCEPDATTVVNQFDQAEFTRLYAGTTYDWNTFYPKLVAAIRAADTQTPILVPVESYSNVSWLPHLVPSGDPRSVYTVHFYNPMTYTHQPPPLNLRYPGPMPVDDGSAQTVDAAWLLGQLQPIRDFVAAHGAPVAITEFGVYRFEPGAPTYLGDVLAALENAGINHTVWLWSSSWPPQADVDEFDLKHGTDPANHVPVPGNPLLQAMQAVWEQNVVRPSNWR